jgi:cytidylate kinase
MIQPQFNSGEDLEPLEDSGASPHHGYQGDRLPPGLPPSVPAFLTIAISREAGSRGGSIAQRVGAKLGWQIYRQDTLEYIAQEGNLRQDLMDNQSPAAKAWVEENLDRLLRQQNLSRHPSVLDMARIILSLGAAGEVILLGRGAGCILPVPSTLNVRIMAPLSDRIAYMAQWLRLTMEEAGAQVNARDSRRAQFIETHFHRKPADVYQYDLLLNSSLLGEEACAQLIVQAARAKLQVLKPGGQDEG